MESNNKKIMIAAASGLAIGALAGVLFAPASGKETRNRIKKTGSQLTDNVNETIEKGKRRLANIKEEIRERLESITDGSEDYL
jgi:gas vesicle protein